MPEREDFLPPSDDDPEIPWPLDGPEVGETIHRLYTKDLKDTGVVGTVLVSVTVDETGAVVDARAIAPEPLHLDEHLTEFMEDASGKTWLTPPGTEDPRLQRIAEEAARAQRFRPALHEGQPVRFDDFRMSFVFGKGT